MGCLQHGGEGGVEPALAGQFGVKGCSKEAPLADNDRLVVAGPENFHSVPDADNPGRTDEDSGHRAGRSELRGELDIGDVGVHLAPETVTHDIDVESSEARLVGLDTAGEQHHAGTGRKDRHAGIDP
jgi:hypothetical protein